MMNMKLNLFFFALISTIFVLQTSVSCDPKPDPKPDGGATLAVAAVAAGAAVVGLIVNQSHKAGCAIPTTAPYSSKPRQAYCWASCAIPGTGLFCYTKNVLDDYYPCTHSNQCDKDWSCHTSCWGGGPKPVGGVHDIVFE